MREAFERWIKLRVQYPLTRNMSGNYIHGHVQWYWKCWQASRADDSAYQPAALPCSRCGGPCVAFTIPNDVWNEVIRTEGRERDEEYICEDCWYQAVRWRLGTGRLRVGTRA
jgi:hypothetical protein